MEENKTISVLGNQELQTQKFKTFPSMDKRIGLERNGMQHKNVNAALLF